MSLEVLAPRARATSVEASLLFLEASQRKPRVDVSYDASALPASDLYLPKRVHLEDARRIATSLDEEGFALRRQVSAVRDFYDDAETASLGRVEAAELVAKATGASHVHVFDHTRRRR